MENGFKILIIQRLIIINLLLVSVEKQNKNTYSI